MACFSCGFPVPRSVNNDGTISKEEWRVAFMNGLLEDAGGRQSFKFQGVHQ